MATSPKDEGVYGTRRYRLWFRHVSSHIPAYVLTGCATGDDIGATNSSTPRVVTG
jgi:hypothetical protein